MPRLPFSHVAGVALGVLLTGVAGLAQSTATLKVYVTVIDADLNVKPVPRHVLLVRTANGAGDAARLVTGFDGKTEIKLTPGTYTLESDRPVEFQGHSYRWKETVTIQESAPTLIELSSDNAIDAAASRPAAPPVTGAPPAPASASAPASGLPDMRGAWLGSYADSTDARLTIDRQDGSAFSGTLLVVTREGRAPSEIQVEGKLSDRSVNLKEVKVINLGGAPSWSLSNSSGSLQADGQHMSGTGRDGRASYKWAFERRDQPDTTTAPAAASGARKDEPMDLQASWEGTYAGSPAVLRIERQDGATWSGSLLVTTQAGKDQTEIQVACRVSGLLIDLREVVIVKLGAARNWKLGSSSGSISTDGKSMRGSGKDNRTSYDWTFTRQ